jgi:hypothetical protein
MEPIANIIKQKRESRVTPTVSRVVSDDYFIELIYCKEAGVTKLSSYRAGEVSVQATIRLDSGEVLEPVGAGNNLIRHGVVLLPEQSLEYSSGEALVEEIRRYIQRYVDLSDAFLGIAAYYVLLTWVYDAFNELPYLRFRGDFGCGKTRALLILGSICYKPFFASGASTVSPIFHTIDTFRGTLIFDEADFRFSDEKAELVKIFNNGNVRGFPVLRTSVTPRKTFDPVAFAVYGPKIVAMREAFQDQALESRFITEEMGQRPVRSDIPINLPDVQKAEALVLRNKLLLYRFRTRGSAQIDPGLRSATLSHRLNQILIPLLSIAPDPSVRAEIVEAAQSLDSTLAVERASRPEALLLEVLAEALMSAAGDRVAIQVLSGLLIERHESEFERPVTNRYVGSLLRRRLRVITFRSHGNFFVPVSELSKVKQLCVRYGVDPLAEKLHDPPD